MTSLLFKLSLLVKKDQIIEQSFYDAKSGGKFQAGYPIFESINIAGQISGHLDIQFIPLALIRKYKSYIVFDEQFLICKTTLKLRFFIIFFKFHSSNPKREIHPGRGHNPPYFK